MALPRKLKNFTLFHNGFSYMGEVPEVTLPKLRRKTEEYRAGGMNAPVELDLGMEKLELEWTAAGMLPQVYLGFGAGAHDAELLRFAGALQSDHGEGVSAMEITVMGRHTEIDSGTAKAGEKTEMKVKTSLSYYRLVVDGVPLIEIDVVNMREVVGDVDRLADVRAALGI
jgi:hypothetical protein